MARFIYGIHPALEALKAAPGQIERIFFAQGPLTGLAARIAQDARALGLAVEFAPRERLARLCEGGVHQGVVLRVADFAYADLEDVLELAAAAGERALVLALDGVEDPHNFGALLRSAWALGAQGVVIAKDRAVGVTGVVVKASAGAAAHLKVSRVTNLARALGQMKDAGLWVSAADPRGDRAPEAVDFCASTALVVGGEGAGIRPNVLSRADFRIRIPMVGELGSLNASVAGGVLLYEIARQRRVRSMAE
jgi:23S rRNA (guanosine2251-2'-O)-methyltransferase